MSYFFTRTTRSHRLPAALALLGAILVGGCSQPSTLQEIREEGVLHVITRVAPSIYYQEQDTLTGYDYELAEAFAAHLGVELRVREADNNPEILSVLERNFAHIGLAGLTSEPALEERFKTVPTGMSVQSVLVYHSEAAGPDSLADLKGQTIHILAGSSHSHVLPDLDLANVESHPDLDIAGLLKRVDSGEFSYAVISSNELDLNHVFFPRVLEAFAFNKPRQLVWLLPKVQDESLARAITDFLEQTRRSGLMAQLQERFYGHLDRLDYVGARTFMHHLDNRLPQYQAMFEQYARNYGMDWRLLAAIGYQESHWRPNAVSPTGVRGLMMLTQTTAKYIGINNRLDAEESIEGGARYFRLIHGRIPERIAEPDRTWFALASYNVGYGHLEDARRLTESAGKDPDRWMDVKEFLPLLTQREWYSKTRFGYARGHEPVTYVQNIRRYYDVLVRITEPGLPADAEPEQTLAWIGPPPEENGAQTPPPAEDESTIHAALPPELGLIPPTL
ncbi:MAG TPA: membrane-bound lytic murein transglycosylase MltF [Marinobacter sp.]|nr:membrane-bound lytic murein transglycosylase MltF [Marinobacter sp.]